MIQAYLRAGFEKWQYGISQAHCNTEWDAWDIEIKTAVDEYNRHLFGKAGYRPLDWRFIKAIVWVETGAKSPEWRSRPMRIGVSRDAGLRSFLSEKEGGDLIVPPFWKGRLTVSSARTVPAHNIRAGIGYLLMRMANFEHRVVLGVNSEIYEVIVEAGDSFDKIAREKGSTVDTLKALNPTVGVLQPGQALRCQKASIQRVITGWKLVSTGLIAQLYNGGGDPAYATKLDYVLSVINKSEASTCAR